MKKKPTLVDLANAALKQAQEDGFTGAHTVFSGFNDAAKKLHGLTPQQASAALEKTGDFRVLPCMLGFRILRAGDVKPRVNPLLKYMGM